VDIHLVILNPFVPPPLSRYVLRRKEKWQRKKEKVRILKDEIKRNGCCVKCGTKENLTFHHRDKSQKKHDIASIQTVAALRKEVAKCDLLCWPCHRLHHLEEDRLKENGHVKVRLEERVDQVCS